MRLGHTLKHLTAPGWLVRRAFPAADLEAIGAAIGASETRHRGELRVVIEGALPLAALWRDDDSRSRAGDLFARYAVDRTREASGILLYLQLLDHRVEILADRGIAARVEPATWAIICRELEEDFAGGHYRAGVLSAIAAISAVLEQHFPAGDDNPNELPDQPQVL
jgi:uncharacterized membrane protein